MLKERMHHNSLGKGPAGYLIRTMVSLCGGKSLATKEDNQGAEADAVGLSVGQPDSPDTSMS